MARQYLLDQRRSRARHPEDEDRVGGIAAHAPAFRKEFAGEDAPGPVDARLGVLGIIVDQRAAAAIALGIMGEGRVGIPGVVIGLAEREMEMKARLFGEVRSVERGGHGRDVGGVEPHRLQIGEAPPDLAQSRLQRERAAIGVDAVLLAADGLEHMPIGHPDLRMRPLGEHGFIDFERLVIFADPAERGGAQIRIRHAAGVGERDLVEKNDRLGRPCLLVEHHREVRFGDEEVGREFDRAAQQILRILVTADPPRQLGEHPHRGDVEGVLLEPALQQRLGIVQPILGERLGRGQHRRVGQGGGDRLLGGRGADHVSRLALAIAWRSAS